MAMESIYNVPEFRYDRRVEQSGAQNRERKQDDKDKKKQKKANNPQASALFESLADSLGQYSEDPFAQFNEPFSI